MGESGWKLLFAFPNQSPDFAQGFACGRVWQQMADNKPLIEGFCLAATRPTIEAMAMTFGWTEEIEDRADGWIFVRLRNPNS